MRAGYVISFEELAFVLLKKYDTKLEIFLKRAIPTGLSEAKPDGETFLLNLLPNGWILIILIYRD